MALIWDGATYHRSQEVREYLESVNQGLDESTGRLLVFALHPMHLSRTRLRMFGCKQNGLFESTTICANLLVL